VQAIVCGARIIGVRRSLTSNALAVGEPQVAEHEGDITMRSPAEHLHTSQDEVLAMTEFEPESVIATRRILIDAETTRVDRHTSSGWGYMALLAAFVLGMCAGILAITWLTVIL
jgi:hypothetical protein